MKFVITVFDTYSDQMFGSRSSGIAVEQDLLVEAVGFGALAVVFQAGDEETGCRDDAE